MGTVSATPMPSVCTPHTLDLGLQILKTRGVVPSCLKMDNKKRLAYAIIRFLHDQLRHGGLSSDAQESLEGTCGPPPALPPHRARPGLLRVFWSSPLASSRGGSRTFFPPHECDSPDERRKALSLKRVEAAGAGG